MDGVEIWNRPMPKELAWRVLDALRGEDLFFMAETSEGTCGSIEGEIRDHNSDQMYMIRDPRPYRSDGQRSPAEKRSRKNGACPFIKS